MLVLFVASCEMLILQHLCKHIVTILCGQYHDIDNMMKPFTMEWNYHDMSWKIQYGTALLFQCQFHKDRLGYMFHI